MPAVVVLALTLALAPAPSPSSTSGPVADLLGGVGQIVDDLLDRGGTPNAPPTATSTPTSTPRSPAVPDQANPARPTAAPTPAGPSAAVRAPGAPVASARPDGGAATGSRATAVPRRDGDAPTPVAPPTFASPARDGWPPVSYLLVLAVLVVLAVLLLRRHRPAAAPAPGPAPGPDPGPLPENVSRLPTSLNAVYELGRLDERLDHERGRRS
ncbi:hypothetical protein ABZU25_32345 [Micromonospora sp. NPDC005215]|uniref:hypothetical protein n=1 Tax=Micromonospora sp. NPDC005215 TaxID=3157024 RepID=UPI0033B8A441